MTQKPMRLLSIKWPKNTLATFTGNPILRKSYAVNLTQAYEKL